jgi:hypothetical protein
MAPMRHPRNQQDCTSRRNESEGLREQEGWRIRCLAEVHACAGAHHVRDRVERERADPKQLFHVDT